MHRQSVLKHSGTQFTKKMLRIVLLGLNMLQCVCDANKKNTTTIVQLVLSENIEPSIEIEIKICMNIFGLFSTKLLNVDF